MLGLNLALNSRMAVARLLVSAISLLLLSGCSDSDQDNSVNAPPPPSDTNRFAGTWDVAFAGNYTGSGPIVIRSDGDCSASVLLYDGAGGSFTNTIDFFVSTDGNVEDGVIYYAGDPIGVVSGGFSGDHAGGTWSTDIPTSGTWSAIRAGAEVDLVASIDIDDPEVGQTAPGMYPLPAVDGGNLSVDGAMFTIFGDNVGWRDRNYDDPMLTDFVFVDGAGRFIGLRIDGLPGGVWQVSSWHFDGGGYDGAVEIQMVTSGSSPRTLVEAFDFSLTPVTYNFACDGASSIELYYRPAVTSSGRARLNGLTISRLY